jgi:hypothetical protein
LKTINSLLNFGISVFGEISPVKKKVEQDLWIKRKRKEIPSAPPPRPPSSPQYPTYQKIVDWLSTYSTKRKKRKKKKVK